MISSMYSLQRRGVVTRGVSEVLQETIPRGPRLGLASLSECCFTAAGPSGPQLPGEPRQAPADRSHFTPWQSSALSQDRSVPGALFFLSSLRMK